jgi:hypothetical protein
MRAAYQALAVAALALAAELAGAQQDKPPTATPASPPAADSTAQTQAAVRAFLTRLATIDVSDEAFQKLDTDHDGRISALEANASPKVAARFLEADRNPAGIGGNGTVTNHDGFLSREEFTSLANGEAIGGKRSGANPPSSSAPP